MPIWIHNYRQYRNKIDVFLYNNDPEVFPQYVTASPIGYNPELFTNEETITVNGELRGITVDFSGCRVGERRYGDAGGVWCGDANQDGVYEDGEGFFACKNSTNGVFPFCNSFWMYSKAHDQGTCGRNTGSISEQYASSAGENVEITPHDPCGSFLKQSCIFDSYWADIAGYNPQPFKKIDPRIPENGKYWNNTNLWYSGGWYGDVLVENDGPKYGEPGGYEYAITVGHPITMSPCDTTLNFCYFDEILGGLACREFECPKKQWESIWQTTSEILLDDTTRLWLMKPGQEPIPPHIKRYKVLQGPIRNNYPSYGFHENFTVTKSISKILNEQTRWFADTDKPYTFGIDPQFLYSSINDSGREQILFSGQGDDGGAVFTVTPDGETIYIGRHENRHGTKNPRNFAYSRSNVDPVRCSTFSDLFIKDERDEELKLNTRCALDIYHRDEITENNDIELYDPSPSFVYFQNDQLNLLNKPKIKIYTFPEFVINFDVNIENISDLNKKYPLKQVPYLSRESKNTFFENSDNIIFRSKKMLQASELNELQEKFYKNQSLFIEYVKNWITYSKIYNLDSLGFSKTISINPNKLFFNSIIPIHNDMVKISKTSSNEDYIVQMHSGWYLLMTEAFPIRNSSGILESFGRTFKNDNFFYLTENKTISINLANLTSSQTNLTTVNIKLSNIINCTNYEELKDNTNGNLQVSPCGADRNLLYFKELKNATYPTPIVFDTPATVFNPLPELPFYPYLNQNLGSNYLLVSTKTADTGTSFYFANDIPIELT